ncbi:MAG: TatD family hydrolase [Gammaproteobacteria bacterium]
MSNTWVDIGINLTDHAFANDLDNVVADARSVGVNTLIITGTDLTGSCRALELCQQLGAGAYCTAGVHPHYAKEWTDEHESRIRDLIRNPAVVAVGETGLDFNRNLSAPDVQKSVFEHQLRIAADSELPLFLHERDALDDQVALLRRYRDRIRGGVAHCFTGERHALQAYLALDLYIGITGWICDERRGLHLRELVQEIPLDRLLLETDGPYLLPRDLQPKPKSRRNEPRYLPHIAQTVAQCLQLPVDELATITTDNARRLFGIS